MPSVETTCKYWPFFNCVTCFNFSSLNCLAKSSASSGPCLKTKACEHCSLAVFATWLGRCAIKNNCIPRCLATTTKAVTSLSLCGQVCEHSSKTTNAPRHSGCSIKSKNSVRLFVNLVTNPKRSSQTGLYHSTFLFFIWIFAWTIASVVFPVFIIPTISTCIFFFLNVF